MSTHATYVLRQGPFATFSSRTTKTIKVFAASIESNSKWLNPFVACMSLANREHVRIRRYVFTMIDEPMSVILTRLRSHV